MKRALSVLLLTILLIAPILQAQVRPIPKGVREADKAEAQTEKNIPPPAPQRMSIDLEKLARQAAELSTIAQTIPPDVANVKNGLLPKDMILRLKQIEKLSKRLRRELDR